MKKNKRETHEGTCVGQSVGVCGGSVELVKEKGKPLREPVWASALAVVDLAALSWMAALGWMVGASQMVAGH
jgi:hypothetical protein